MDECQNDPELCTNGVCRNTQGSFECICGKGYVLAKGTTACIGTVLVDINAVFFSKRVRERCHATLIQSLA